MLQPLLELIKLRANNTLFSFAFSPEKKVSAVTILYDIMDKTSNAAYYLDKEIYM